MPKKVFVSGCFDLLHSGHIEFLQEAASFGELYVALGSDRTVYELKGRAPVNSQEERLFIVSSVSCVKKAFISQGSGILDFENELRDIQPQVFIVNEDGNVPSKRELCERLGIQYLMLRRTPHPGLSPRSTTALRSMNLIPYRIDLAGGWLDQPFVSRFYPGSVITVSLEPTIDFNERSGMASSTRRKAIDLWGTRLPVGPEEKLAKILFCYDNPPGTKEVSGSQDSIGIVFPGVNNSLYEGEYWPSRIDPCNDDDVLDFLQNALYLVPLGPRHSGFNVLSNKNVTREGAKELSDVTDACWKALLAKNLVDFGKYFRMSFEAQIAMFPNMVSDSIMQLIHQYQQRALGWKLSGAGGGGYLIFICEHPIEDAITVTVRRRAT
jgi:cytidyltransferase-like protein